MGNLISKIKSDTKAIPLGVKLVVLVIFLRALGWGFVDPYFSIFVSEFTGSYAGVGSLISIMNFTSLLAIIPLVRLADKVKDTTIMRDGEVMYFFAITFYLLASSTGRLPFLILAFICSGIAYPFVIVGVEAYIRKRCNAKCTASSFGFYTALHYLGWISGMVLGAFGFQYYGFKYMFLFVLPSVIIGFYVLQNIKESGLKSLFSGITKYFHRREDFKAIAKDIKELNNRTFFIMLLAFFDGAIVMFTFIFIPLFAISLNLSLREVALLMAFAYMPFVFSYIISEATEQLKRINLITTGLFIGAISFVLLALVLDYTWVLVLTAINSLSLAIVRPAYNGMLTQLTPRRILGEVTGLNNIMMRLGYVIGPIVTGHFADKYSLQHAFVVMAIFAFFLATSCFLFRGIETLKNKAVNV